MCFIKCTCFNKSHYYNELKTNIYNITSIHLSHSSHYILRNINMFILLSRNMSAGHLFYSNTNRYLSKFVLTSYNNYNKYIQS